jgi:hypothetical protein
LAGVGGVKVMAVTRSGASDGAGAAPTRPARRARARPAWTHPLRVMPRMNVSRRMGRDWIGREAGVP